MSTSKPRFSESTLVPVELSTGATIPLRPIKAAKTNNVYHAVLKSDGRGGHKHPGKWGVKVDASVVGGSLPEKVTIAGVTIVGVKGTSQGGNPKMTYSERISVEGLGERQFKLTISELKDGVFNVGGSLNRPGGGGSQTVATSL